MKGRDVTLQQKIKNCVNNKTTDLLILHAVTFVAKHPIQQKTVLLPWGFAFLFKHIYGVCELEGQATTNYIYNKA